MLFASKAEREALSWGEGGTADVCLLINKERDLSFKIASELLNLDLRFKCTPILLIQGVHKLFLQL